MIDLQILRQREAIPVPRIAMPTVKSFQKEFVDRNRPVIITGMPKTFRTRSISPDDLARTLGGKSVRVHVCDRNGQTFVVHRRTKTPSLSLREMPFDRFLAHVRRRNGACYYFQSPFEGEQYPFTSLPELGTIVEYPPFVKSFGGGKLWIGGGGNRTGLHYDPVDNLLFQIRGKKEILLYDPADSGLLYHCPLAPDRLFNCSLVDVAKPNHSRFPLFQIATPHYAEIEPGEMLFIPLFWWHYVASAGFNMAANFWWNIGTKELWRERIRSRLLWHERLEKTIAAQAATASSGRRRSTARA